jgi:hypothetical protein
MKIQIVMLATEESLKDSFGATSVEYASIKKWDKKEIIKAIGKALAWSEWRDVFDASEEDSDWHYCSDITLDGKKKVAILFSNGHEQTCIVSQL